MRTYLAEATNGLNWGKFLVCLMDTEWTWHSRLDPHALILRACGWNKRDICVLDLATGEGAVFTPGGIARNDLNKHKIHVCVLFEPFLEWLYSQDLTQLPELLADVVYLPDAPEGLRGYRRPGLSEETSS